MIVVAGRISVHPDKIEAAIPHYLKMVEETKKEEGCLMYDFYADLADPNTLLVFEEWESMEHLEAHFKTPHMAEFRTAIADVVTGVRSIKKYYVEKAEAL